MRALRWLPLALLVACGGKDEGTDTATGTGTTATGTTGTNTTGTNTTGTNTTGTTQALSLAADVQPIFDASCAISGCHAGNNPAQGLDLSAGNAYDALVNVPSTQDSMYHLVEPGDADASYLVMKVEGTAMFGNPMPPSGSLLPSDQQQTIRDWIDQGANP